jgi:predicted RNase H-like HicB family nuclease
MFREANTLFIFAPRLAYNIDAFDVNIFFLNVHSPPHAGRRCLMIFHVIMEQDEDGWFVVECPALPGCVSQGRDEEEALANIKEAITAWLWAEDQKAVCF